MDDEELCVPEDVLEEASASRYQMLPKKSQLRYRKELEKFTSGLKPVSESEVNENINIHPLVTTDTDSLSRKVSNKNMYWLFINI
jgi:hypothetical protein